MLTFNQIYSECQDQIQDYSTSMVATIKRGINQGMHKFGAILNRDWRDDERTFSTVAAQQWYQMPEDAIRINNLTVTVGSVVYPVEEIADRPTWDQLNMRVQQSSVPQYYFVKGSDQFGIWPVPSGVNTGTLSFERSMRDMTADDVTSPGTIAVTGGVSATAAVVGTSTTFNANMVGRVLFVDPTGATGDGAGYKIDSFTDTTHITLENAYGGITGSSKSYLIGEVPDIPDEFHEALVDYGLYRAYRRRRDLGTAKDLKAAFDESLMLCEQNYSSKTASQYVRSPRPYSGYRQYKRDLTIP